MAFRPDLWVKNFFRDEIPNKTFYKHDSRMFYWYEKLALIGLEIMFLVLAALSFYQFSYYMYVLSSVPNVALFQPVMLFFAGIFLLSAFSLTLNLFRNRQSKTVISLLNIGVLATHMILTLTIYMHPIYSQDVVSIWVGWTMVGLSSFGLLMALIVVMPHVEITPAHHTHHNFDKKTNKWYVGRKPADPMEHVAGIDKINKELEDKMFAEFVEGSENNKTIEKIIENKKVIQELKEDDEPVVTKTNIEIVKTEKKPWYLFGFTKKEQKNSNEKVASKKEDKKSIKTNSKKQVTQSKVVIKSWNEYYNEMLIKENVDWKINELKAKKDLSEQQQNDLLTLEKIKESKLKTSTKVKTISNNDEVDNIVVDNVYNEKNPTSWHQYYYEQLIKSGKNNQAAELKKQFPSITIKNKTHDFKVNEKKVKEIKHVLDVSEQISNKKELNVKDSNLKYLVDPKHKKARKIEEMIDPVWSKEKTDVEDEFYKAVEEFKSRSYSKKTQEAEVLVDLKINEKLNEKK